MRFPAADPRFHRLKSATRDLVAACGGAERAAALVGLGDSQVSRWQVASEPDLIGVAAVMVMETECGLAPVTRVLAEATGRALGLPESALDAGGTVMASHAAVMTRAADLMRETAAALADGRITPAEAERMCREAGAVERALGGLRQALAAVKAGGAA